LTLWLSARNHCIPAQTEPLLWQQQMFPLRKDHSDRLRSSTRARCVQLGQRVIYTFFFYPARNISLAFQFGYMHAGARRVVAIVPRNGAQLLTTVRYRTMTRSVVTLALLCAFLPIAAHAQAATARAQTPAQPVNTVIEWKRTLRWNSHAVARRRDVGLLILTAGLSHLDSLPTLDGLCTFVDAAPASCRFPRREPCRAGRLRRFENLPLILPASSSMICL
jgi:hypothetical protein